MSFYSYKNANPDASPGRIMGDAVRGLDEKVCVQVKRVYDSCMQQESIENVNVTVTTITPVICEEPCCGGGSDNVPLPSVAPPVCFESCRSCSSSGTVRNLSIDRLCDRPQFARIRGVVDIPVDILFSDSKCQEFIGRGVISVTKDVLMSIPDESIVPFTLETLVSAICVTGTYVGNNQFQLTACVTIILKILAEVEMLIPSYGFCPIPPCEEFSENVCDEFFSLPIFPQQSIGTDCTCPPGCTPALAPSASNACPPSCGCGSARLPAGAAAARLRRRTRSAPSSTR